MLYYAIGAAEGLLQVMWTKEVILDDIGKRCRREDGSTHPVVKDIGAILDKYEMGIIPSIYNIMKAYAMAEHAMRTERKG